MLASYVDTGRALILFNHTAYNNNERLGGRFLKENYHPLCEYANYEFGSEKFMASPSQNCNLYVNTSHPILNGVFPHKISGGQYSARGKATIQTHAKLIAVWQDGHPFISECYGRKGVGTIVSLNMCPTPSTVTNAYWKYWPVESDTGVMIVNTYLYAGKTLAKVKQFMDCLHKMRKQAVYCNVKFEFAE